MNVFSKKPDADVLALRGSRIPSFERSVTHAASRDAVRILNEIHATQDPDNTLLAEFWETDQGKKLLESLDAYQLHILSKKAR
jgi:hypothetical protein